MGEAQPDIGLAHDVDVADVPSGVVRSRRIMGADFNRIANENGGTRGNR